MLARPLPPIRIALSRFASRRVPAGGASACARCCISVASPFVFINAVFCVSYVSTDTFFLFARRVRYILLSTGTFSLRGISPDRCFARNFIQCVSRDIFLLIRCSSHIWNSLLIFCIIRSVVYILSVKILTIMKSSTLSFAERDCQPGKRLEIFRVRDSHVCRCQKCRQPTSLHRQIDTLSSYTFTGVEI